MQVRRPLLSLLFLSFATIALAQQQTDFVHQTYAAPQFTSHRAAIDLNNDGATDVVMDGGSDLGVYVMLSNGDGSFQAAREYAVGDSIQDIAVGDVDGDGNADVVLSVYDAVHNSF